MKLYSVSDMAAKMRVSNRWIQRLAKEFDVGRRVGNVIIFTETDAALFAGEEPEHTSINVPVNPSIAEILRQTAEMEGKSLELLVSGYLMAHLQSLIDDG